MSSDDEPNVEEENFVWKLDTIPTELFLHICSFLSAKFLSNVLSKVCQQFHELIQSDLNWRVRIFERWPNRYPVIAPAKDFNWREACLSREEQYNLWKNRDTKFKTYCIKGAHYASVDAVLIIEDGNLCVSGARDKSWKLWDFQSLDNQEPNINCDQNYHMCLKSSCENAHDGWVWSFAYDKFHHTLFSGGFDFVINGWQMDAPPNKSFTYKFNSPILSLAFTGNTLSCGTYFSKVYQIDPRQGNRFQFAYKHRKGKPVLCMTGDERFIISGCEDGSVVVFDKIAAKVLNTIELEKFPLSLSYGDGLLLAGDLKGSIHYMDPKEKFELVKSYESGHEKKITGVQHSHGSIITCSTDKTIRILEPSVDPNPIAVLECDSEISGIAVHGDTLVSANTDDTISVWLPKADFAD